MANSSYGRAIGACYGSKSPPRSAAKLSDNSHLEPPMNDSEVARSAEDPVSDSHEALMNEHEVAARLGLKVATLRRWRWAGRSPPYIKIGSAVRYHPPDIAAFIDAGRRASTTDRGQEA